jgi:hypothetical protein
VLKPEMPLVVAFNKLKSEAGDYWIKMTEKKCNNKSVVLVAN